MKILLFGADGQLGWQLRRSLSVVGEVTALTRRSTSWCGDLTDSAGIVRAMRELRPDVVVNAAAYTTVDMAQTQGQLANAVNAQACEVLAAEAASLGAWIVHYSTDYVFDGTGTQPWRETDPTEPLNAYGRGKLAGERAVARHCPHHLILRSSWLFDTWGGNFLKWLLAAATHEPQLSIVDDQWGSPTRAALVADVTALLLRHLEPASAGTYHVAAAGETSRHGFAAFALECAAARGWPLQVRASDLRPVPSSYFATPALRPANSRLDTSRIRSTFGIALPPWQEGVEAVVAELAAARALA